jgi:hypothetical protein
MATLLVILACLALSGIPALVTVLVLAERER